MYRPTADGAAHVVIPIPRPVIWLRGSEAVYVTQVTDRPVEILLECDPPATTHEELTGVWYCDNH
jgi:hypothetical protein